MDEKVRILGLKIDNLTMLETIDNIARLIEENQNAMIFTPNVHRLVFGKKDSNIEEIYQKADMLIPDGMPLIWASRILGTPLKEKVSGSDLLPLFCQYASKKGYKLYFLGSAPGIADEAKDILMQNNPGLKIIGTYSPPLGFENNIPEIIKITEMIKRENPDILFLGLGFPKEEEFLRKYKDIIQVPVSMGIGATFDFITGKQKRAPLWMQNCGFEWLHRLSHDPKRLWKRYLIGNTIFVFLVFREIIQTKLFKKTSVNKSASQ